MEQIAEAAEVSPSTFFRYFPAKEDVVLFDALDPLLIEAYRRQPPGLSPIQAIRRGMRDVFGAMSPEEIEEQRERGRLVYLEPALRAALVADLLRTAALMATILAERAGLDPNEPRVRTYSGAVIGALMAAMIPKLEDPESDIVGDMEAALDFLEGGLVL